MELLKTTVFTGAADVIVSIDKNGFLRSTDFKVTFGGILDHFGTGVKLIVNNIETDLKMKVGVAGYAHFSEDEKLFKPLHEDLLLLKLKIGKNEVIYKLKTLFTFYTINADIYLWDIHSKLVISDIDGTITKSDFLGMVLPVFGLDYIQPLVVKTENAVYNNNYKIIYLTARPIIQSISTRNYIRKIEQDGFKLPPGPIVTTALTIFDTLRTPPEKFKAETLDDIKCVFNFSGVEENDSLYENPLYAGFGNQTTDDIAYFVSGIKRERIWIINPIGEINLKDGTKTSYREILENIDLVFPPINIKNDI